MIIRPVDTRTSLRQTDKKRRNWNKAAAICAVCFQAPSRNGRLPRCRNNPMVRLTVKAGRTWSLFICLRTLYQENYIRSSKNIRYTKQFNKVANIAENYWLDWQTAPASKPGWRPAPGETRRCSRARLSRRSDPDIHCRAQKAP